ncbi:hypothetical protein [Novosphingobium sp. CCH12-A3]|uniref:hypothetical protein n=1 Tax=Novosphingobium sp. CCH12-A3 TaxID=1768752 RepID=UPI0007824E92|nr:hypothetical protein [Novosphingobium sp. CCH12-A3]
MKNTVSKLAAAVAAGSLLLAGAAADAKPRLTSEQELAKALEGRVAGEPKDCIYLPRVVNTRVYDKTAIIYDTGTTIWVNRPDSGASSLDDNDIMVTTPWNSQLCSVDIVRMVDRNAGFWRGSIGLGKFVPYTKVKAEKTG